MRILLDECVPRKLKLQLSGHSVSTVREMGWSSFKNGALLAMAATQFEVFLTVDQNLPHQQTLSNYTIAVLILCAPNNRLATLTALIPEAEAALATIQPGEFVLVGAP